MPEATAAGALDVAEPLRRERAGFTSVLAALPAAAWDLPTECPAWTVKGIALHVLGRPDP